MAVDGEVVAVDAPAADSALARPHVHRLAVGEDEVGFFAEGEGVVEVHFGQADEVPTTGEGSLRAVEGDSLSGLCFTVLIDVADGYGLAGAADLAGVAAHGDVVVGHGEGAAAQVGGGDVVIAGILHGEAVFVAEGCAGVGVVQGDLLVLCHDGGVAGGGDAFAAGDGVAGLQIITVLIPVTIIVAIRFLGHDDC